MKERERHTHTHTHTHVENIVRDGEIACNK